jgi:hypothetical protein
MQIACARVASRSSDVKVNALHASAFFTLHAWEIEQSGEQDKSSCPHSSLVTRHMTVPLTCDFKENIHLPTNVSFGDTCT